ncbi:MULTISPECIES: hypothetical protein [Aerosakkonema]|uniref:hypothetical protein n=1 Tax=Aerosakkonema TaxID=1246629 RepID=UPI0035BB874C
MSVNKIKNSGREALPRRPIFKVYLPARTDTEWKYLCHNIVISIEQYGGDTELMQDRP